MLEYIETFWISLMEIPRGVIVKELDSDLEVSKFKLQSRNYVNFRANTLEKGMNSYLTSCGLNSTATRMTLTFDNPQRLICHHTKKPNQMINLHHHHHVVLPAWISLTLCRHPFLSSIAPGRSSRLHPISCG